MTAGQIEKAPVDVYVLAGFLGSGKTTLLMQALAHLKASGKKAAVIMNEIGDVNLDGQLLDMDVPMAELLGGCICCSIGGDLGLTILALCRDVAPDVILIEATGIANPLEIIHNVTDASLLKKVELRQLVTVVNAPAFLELCRGVKGRNHRLMGEQILAAGRLILNKIDKVAADDLGELEREVRQWNPSAPIQYAVQCQDCLDFLTERAPPAANAHAAAHGSVHGEHDHHHEHDHRHEEAHTAAGHSSHEHVMVHTRYFAAPISRDRFEDMMRNLPPNIYRAKGILRFRGEDRSYFFQYSYRELEIFPNRPREDLPQVAVFMGERFSGTELATALNELESAPAARGER